MGLLVIMSLSYTYVKCIPSVINNILNYRNKDVLFLTCWKLCLILILKGKGFFMVLCQVVWILTITAELVASCPRIQAVNLCECVLLLNIH
jgi:hypothetical protein